MVECFAESGFGPGRRKDNVPVRVTVIVCEACAVEQGTVSALRIGLTRIWSDEMPGVFLGSALMVFTPDDDDPPGEASFQLHIEDPSGEKTPIGDVTIVVTNERDQVVVAASRVHIPFSEHGGFKFVASGDRGSGFVRYRVAPKGSKPA